MLKRIRARLCRRLGLRSTRNSQGTTQRTRAWREAILNEPSPPYPVLGTDKPIALLGEPLNPEKVFIHICDDMEMFADRIYKASLQVSPRRRAAVAAALAAEVADVVYGAAVATANSTVTPSYLSHYAFAHADAVAIAAYGVAAEHEAMTRHPRSVFDLMERDGFGRRIGMGGRCFEPEV